MSDSVKATMRSFEKHRRRVEAEQEERIEELQADQKRLEWMFENEAEWDKRENVMMWESDGPIKNIHADTPRAAIDKAMEVADV